jgi:hypothetical protein
MVGAVGVAEERVVALTIVGKDESRWKWWLLLLLLVLRSRWQRIRFLHRGGRERERFCDHHVRWLGDCLW